MLEVIIRESFMHPKQHVPRKRERGGGGEGEQGFFWGGGGHLPPLDICLPPLEIFAAN